MCIFIQDNGIGRRASVGKSAGSNGKGLRFSEERLDLLADKYGDDYSLEISDLADEQGAPAGTLVKICFAIE